MKVTENEMADTLLEFHQRNQGLIKPVGPPPPFEVTSVVSQQQPPLLQRSRRQDDPPPDVQQRTLVRPETEVDFEIAQIIPYQPGQPYGTYGFVINFRCHNADTISEPCYIRTYSNYWLPVTTGNTRCTPPIPIIGGGAVVRFYGSSWTPTHDNQYIQAQVSLLGVPPCPILSNINIWSYNNFYVERVSDGTYMDTIYGLGYIQNWSWLYPTADPGIIESQLYAFI